MSNTPDAKVAAAPALDHRQFGMFVASGPNIKKNEKIFGLSLIDVAPTILHHYGLPVGKDMDGKVILDIYKDVKEPILLLTSTTTLGSSRSSLTPNNALASPDCQKIFVWLSSLFG